MGAHVILLVLSWGGSFINFVALYPDSHSELLRAKLQNHEIIYIRWPGYLLSTYGTVHLSQL